jgi:4-hydroxy-2-oxoheptanedioate aldolase
MPAPVNRLKTMLKSRTPAIGVIATIPSVQTARILAQSLDFLIVDLEHGPIDLNMAHAMMLATAGTNCTPMARISENKAALAKAPMDLGAMGINFPMVNSAADAAHAVASVRYPPKGERQWGPFHAPFAWGMPMPEYMAAADENMLCMITIEHIDAVNRIDEIMAVPGIDIAVIGPGDLATSMGKHGRADDPEVVAAMQKAEAAILKSGTPIGGAARTVEQANAMIARGYGAIAVGFDWMLLQRGIAASLDGIKRG